MIQLPPDFKEFLQLLNVHNIQYLIIDGYAVGYHGYPRATADLDIWICVNQNNANKLVQAVKDFGFDVPGLSSDTFLQQDKIIRMGKPPLRIELHTSIPGVTFDECYKNCLVDIIEEIQVNLINLEHLKQNKLASGRYRDFDDLEHLP